MKVQSSHLVALFRHVSETVTVEFHPSGPNPRWALMRASGAYGEAVGLLLVHHVLVVGERHRGEGHLDRHPVR